MRGVRGVINTRGRRGPLDAGSWGRQPPGAGCHGVQVFRAAARRRERGKRGPQGTVQGVCVPGRGGHVPSGQGWGRWRVGGRAIPLVAAVSVAAGAAGDECDGAHPAACAVLSSSVPAFPNRFGRSRCAALALRL